MHFHGTAKGGIQSVSFYKGLILQDGVIFESVVSDEESTMKALFKQCFKDIKSNNPKCFNHMTPMERIKTTQGSLPMIFMMCWVKNVTKIDNYWGLYHRHIFAFFTSLLIFLPSLEVLFFMDYYFLVCIFKYRTSTCTFSLKMFFKFWVIYLVVIFPLRIIFRSRQSTKKNRTPEKTTAEDRCSLIPWLRIYDESSCRYLVTFNLC